MNDLHDRRFFGPASPGAEKGEIKAESWLF
jgi:hypothetical protein